MSPITDKERRAVSHSGKFTTAEATTMLGVSFGLSAANEHAQLRLFKITHALFPAKYFDLEPDERLSVRERVAGMARSMIHNGLHGATFRDINTTAQRFGYTMERVFSGKPESQERLLPLVLYDLLQRDAKYTIGECRDNMKGELVFIPSEGRPATHKKADKWRSAFAENVVRGDSTGSPYIDEVCKGLQKLLNSPYWGQQYPLQLRLAAYIIDTYNNNHPNQSKVLLPSYAERLLAGKKRVLSLEEVAAMGRIIVEPERS